MENKVKVKTLVIGVMIAAIIFGGVYILIHVCQKESGVNIAYHVVCNPGSSREPHGNGERENMGDSL